MNRLTNMLDAAGTTRYTYTAVSQLLSEDGPWSNDTITYGYTAMQRTSLSLQQPTSSWTNGFAYDNAKRLTSVTSPVGTFDYYYDAARAMLPEEITLPNTSYITNVYDGNARLLTTTLKNSAGATLDAAQYGYNAGNQRTAFTNAAGTHVSYTYDPIGQLKVATSSVSSENRGYAYDAAWNLADLTNNGVNTAFSVNNLNELTTVGTTNFAYDSNGNLTNKTVGSLSTTNIYDDENRLIWVSTTNLSKATLTTFVYDGLSRMREQLQWTNSLGGASNTWILVGGTAYVYDGNRVIQERDLNNNPTVSYTRGNDLSGTLEGAGGIGGLLARSDGYASGFFSDHNFYHADGNGNITYLVNSAQTLAASYRYDPFGNLLNSSGSLAVSNTYRFSSKEFIPSVGLYYYLYRFYDPALQRWLNRDPLGEPGFHAIRHVAEGKTRPGRLTVGAELTAGPNLYWFVGNRPINVTDPLGLQGYGNPVSGPNGPVGPSSPYVPGPYYPNGYLYTPGPPLFDTGCFSDCMNTWLGGNCLRYGLGVIGSGAVAGGLSTPTWFAGLQMPFYEAAGYYLGATYVSSTLAAGTIAVGGTVVAAGGVVAAAGAGWALGTAMQCLSQCSK